MNIQPNNNIASKIYDYIDTYIAIEERTLMKVVAWILMAHLQQAFDIIPLLAIVAAKSRSGKTNLLKLVQILTPDSERWVAASPASIYTHISACDSIGITPTLCLDEMDRTYGQKQQNTEVLTAILDASCEIDGTIAKAMFEKTTKGESKRQLERLKCRAPIAFAGIDRGGLFPDTLMDRSIVARLQRRNRKDPNQKKRQFRVRNYKADGLALKDEIIKWATEERIEAARGIIPDMVPGVEDREADKLEPLLVVLKLVDMEDTAHTADTANTTKTRGSWESRMAKVAEADVSEYDENDDTEGGVALLRDIVKVIAENKEGYDWNHNTKVPTEYLLTNLTKLPEAPWNSMSETKSPSGKFGFMARGLQQVA